MNAKPMPDNPYHYIDPQVLFESVAEDIDLFRVLSASYRDMTPAMLTRLQAALMAGDCKSISHECHSLRGTTSLVGAIALTALLLSIEQDCRNGQPAALASYGTPLATLFDRTLQEVEFSITHFNGDGPGASGETGAR